MATYDQDYDPLGRYTDPAAPAGPITAPAKPPLGDIGGAYQRGAQNSIGAGLGLAAREVATSPAANVIGRTVAAGATPVPSAIRAIGGQIYDAGRAFLTGEAAPTAGPLVSAANAMPPRPIAPAGAPIAAEPGAQIGERTPGTSVRLEGATPEMLQAIAADMQGGRNYSPITRTRAGPSRAAYLQARQSDEGEPPTGSPPTGSIGTARVEQYFTPPSGPVGGPLNRGGVQIQNADGTITMQPPDVAGQPVTPQIRPQGGGAPVQVIGGVTGCPATSGGCIVIVPSAF